MSQVFIFVNIDLEQSSHHLGELADLATAANGLSSTMAMGYTPPFSVLLERNKCLRSLRAVREGDLGALGRLPTELIKSIAQETNYLRAIKLAITNSQLLSIIYPIIAMKAEAWWRTFHWANCRILCLGSECNDPLPPGCRTKSLQKRLKKVTTMLSVADTSEDYENLLDSASLFSLAHSEGFTRVHTGSQPDGPKWKEYVRTSVQGQGFSTREEEQYLLLCQICKPPVIGNRVLINDTKKEFIKEGQGVVFKWALLPMIIWAGNWQDRRVEINLRGRWAGDCVAIISSEDFAGRKGYWKDVAATTLKAQQDWVSFLEYFHGHTIDIEND
ncbi:hypothetical protein ONZ45_g15156 [Pleurotus djamor]|nr:hypothetical protein ONZ45_g15156 [Pleurotus djamor]